MKWVKKSWFLNREWELFNEDGALLATIYRGYRDGLWRVEFRDYKIQNALNLPPYNTRENLTKVVEKVLTNGKL